MSEYITLADALAIIDSGKPFDIEVVTADVKRGTGGRVIAYANATKAKRDGSKLSKPMDLKLPTRNPQHYLNSTRNITLLKERETRKIHIRLITKINGKIVL